MSGPSVAVSGPMAIPITVQRISTYDLIGDLALELDDYALEGRQLRVGSDFTRLSTVIHLRGAGHEGVGEDVTYDGLDHMALQDAGPVLPIAGDFTMRSFRARLDE